MMSYRAGKSIGLQPCTTILNLNLLRYIDKFSAHSKFLLNPGMEEQRKWLCCVQKLSRGWLKGHS